MVKIAQFFMSQKFEKPVKWEHFDRLILPIPRSTWIKSILKHLHRVPLNRSFPELTYPLDTLLKISSDHPP